MPRFGKLALSVGALALLAAPASAQRPGGGFGGGPLMLLQNKSVAQELKLTDDQAARIKTAADATREKYRDQFQTARDLDARERVAKMEELQKASAADGKKTIAEVLKPEQADRLAQIERQENPLQALNDSEVQAKLKLTASQKDKIAQLHDDLQKEQRAAFTGGGGDQAERRERMERVRAARKDANDKATALLTDEQTSTWKDLVGSPFEIKREQRGRGN